MRIIRDEECFGLMMIPLLCDWNIRRCNVAGCKNKPNTIITGMAPDVPQAGFCEEHYQQGNVPGDTEFTLEFDSFDAFKQEANDGTS